MNTRSTTARVRSSDYRIGCQFGRGLLLWTCLLPLAFLATFFCACGLHAGQVTFADVSTPSASPATNTPGTSVSRDATSTNATTALVSAGGTNAGGLHPINNMDALDNQYRLAIGDRLSFRIVEDDDDPRPLTVTDSGELEVPYIGRCPAVGKTCKELARELKGELEKDYYYQATVIVAVDLKTKSRGKVYLVGSVRVPGPQDIPSDEVLTLSKAILRAGGFTDYADKRDVKVTRKTAVTGLEEQTFTVDVGRILEKGKMDTDLPLQPGDLIYISERLVRF